jgi:hypothetical protein
MWVPTRSAFAFTVYDAIDAPAELLTRESGVGYSETCHELPDGTEECVTDSVAGPSSPLRSGWSAASGSAASGGTTVTSIAVHDTVPGP